MPRLPGTSGYVEMLLARVMGDKGLEKRLLGIVRRIVRSGIRALGAPYAPYLAGKLALRLSGRGKGHTPNMPVRFQRILLLRLDGIGDVVLNASLIRELRRFFPQSWITLVVQPQVYKLVELCPYVNEVLTCGGAMSRYFYPIQAQWRAVRLVWRHLWGRRFDLALVPRWGADSSGAPFAAYYSGATWRVGYSERSNALRQAANRGYDRLFTHVLLDSALKHEVEHNLDVLRFLGGQVSSPALELWLSREDEQWAEEALGGREARSEGLLIAFGFGASSRHRSWPAANFVQLARRLNAKADCRFVLLGGAGQEAEGDEIQHGLDREALSLAGKTTLRQAAALLKRCDLFIGSDSALMHLAAAAGKPVVMISCHPASGDPYHTNSPEFFRPWTESYHVCQPAAPIPPCKGGCGSRDPHCILGVTVDQVESAATALLASLPCSGNHTAQSADSGPALRPAQPKSPRLACPQGCEGRE